jgi:Helix-turn-helix domain
MKPAPDERLVDVNAAAALTGRAPETIRRWVWAGRLPAQRRGRKLVVDRRDVLRLATGTARTPTLAQWRKLVLRHHRDSRPAAQTGASAVDLVLADRRLRESADAGR